MSPRKMYPRKTYELGRGAVGQSTPKCLSPTVGVWEKGQICSSFLLSCISFTAYFLFHRLNLTLSFLSLLFFLHLSLNRSNILPSALLRPLFTPPFLPSFVLFNSTTPIPSFLSALTLLITPFSSFIYFLHSMKEADQLTAAEPEPMSGK